MSLLDTFKSVWRRAVVIVGIGGTFATALYVAMQEQGVDCGQWATVAQHANDVQGQYTYYAARKQGLALPDTLGMCQGGICSITPEGCSDSVQYQIKTGPFVTVGGNNWQVVQIEAHPLVAGRLKAFADDNPTSAKWLGSFGQLVETCLTLTTASNCRQLIAPLSDCWLQPDGTLCRYGITTRIDGPGQPGDGACQPVNGSRPYPCETTRGPQGAQADFERVWDDSDLQ